MSDAGTGLDLMSITVSKQYMPLTEIVTLILGNAMDPLTHPPGSGTRLSSELSNGMPFRSGFQEEKAKKDPEAGVTVCNGYGIYQPHMARSSPAPKARPRTAAEQRLALSLVADAITRGDIRTFKQLEKLGFLYRPDDAINRGIRSAGPRPRGGARGGALQRTHASR